MVNPTLKLHLPHVSHSICFTFSERELGQQRGKRIGALGLHLQDGEAASWSDLCRLCWWTDFVILSVCTAWCRAVPCCRRPALSWVKGFTVRAGPGFFPCSYPSPLCPILLDCLWNHLNITWISMHAHFPHFGSTHLYRILEPPLDDPKGLCLVKLWP